MASLLRVCIGLLVIIAAVTAEEQTVTPEARINIDINVVPNSPVPACQFFVAAKYWRVANAEDTTWRPAVSEFDMFADIEQQTELTNAGQLISSGSTTSAPDTRAIDNNPNTAWRPHIHSPGAFKAWIGLRFDAPTVVRSATAKGLGTGSGGGNSWNGGLALQYSHDGETWTTAGVQSNSNMVQLPEPVFRNPCVIPLSFENGTTVGNLKRLIELSAGVDDSSQILAFSQRPIAERSEQSSVENRHQLRRLEDPNTTLTSSYSGTTLLLAICPLTAASRCNDTEALYAAAASPIDVHVVPEQETLGLTILNYITSWHLKVWLAYNLGIPVERHVLAFSELSIAERAIQDAVDERHQILPLGNFASLRPWVGKTLLLGVCPLTSSSLCNDTEVLFASAAISIDVYVVPEEETVSLEVLSYTTILEVKLWFQTRNGIYANQQVLAFPELPAEQNTLVPGFLLRRASNTNSILRLEDTTALGSYDFDTRIDGFIGFPRPSAATLLLGSCPSAPTSPCSDREVFGQTGVLTTAANATWFHYSITVVVVSTRQRVDLTVLQFALIEDIKAVVQQETGIDNNQQVLTYNRIRLVNGTVASNNLPDAATLILGICPRGSCSDDELFTFQRARSNSDLTCPTGFSLFEYPILLNAQYNATSPSTFTSSQIITFRRFDGVEARYAGGFISCNDDSQDNPSQYISFAWQSCKGALPDLVTGAAFELFQNSQPVFAQPNWWTEANGCSQLDPTPWSFEPVTCSGQLDIDPTDTLHLGWYESNRGVSLGDNLGTIAVDLIGLVCERDRELEPTQDSTPCREAEAEKCHATAFCANNGDGGKCFCPEGSVGDGVSKRYGGSSCSRQSWALRVSFDLGPDLDGNPPALISSGERLDFWEVDRVGFSDLLFNNVTTEKPDWFDTSMYHVITDEHYLTVYALFFTMAEAELAADVFYNKTRGTVPFLFGTSNSRLTVEPLVATFVSQTSETEIRVSPTGMDVLNVYYQHDCFHSGCWVIDLIYTTGEDNFNVFYIPKAEGNDPLSYDFDYKAIPDYAVPYGKSPADTFLPLNFPCGSNGYEYKPGPHIPDRVSSCCVEEFTKLYRPVDTFLEDPKVQEVLSPSREAFCAAPARCAAENGTCACKGTVQYGAGGQFLYQESSGALECSNNVFGGDPNPGVAKTCHCSPTRKIWTKDYMPDSALQGNFSGMNGLARVDFNTVEDPFVNQFTATVYLDEAALRQRAGLLTGQLGVAYSIETFIGFANFKPTGLEFVDMFAAQTNMYLEKTSFFTVGVYGENDYTFLEYVNLRLITVLEEEVIAPFKPRFDEFDVFHLTTKFARYPLFPGRGTAILEDESQVWITEEPDGGYRVHYYLTGLPVTETQGGIHIHEGTSCATHEQVLGHYFSTQTDPWIMTWTKDTDTTVAEGSVYVANPGFPLSQNERHAFVVHEQDGDRIACGTLRKVLPGRTSRTNSADYLQVTFTLGEQYQPIETGIIPVDSVLVSKGAFISDSETLETRFHACSEYVGGSFYQKDLFDSRFPTKDSQLCAPNATMCYNPPYIPDQFVHFNIPLGIDWLPPYSNSLDSNVFVDLVVSVIDSHQIAVPGGTPNHGDPAEQMKTTLKASIPVVEGGVYIFCDTVVRRDDLHDVAKADLILGSAGYENEFERLQIIKDLAKSIKPDPNVSYIDTDSIEAGLMTLVVRGNESYFGREGDYALQVEDVITIHVMEPETGTKYQSVLDLLLSSGLDSNVADVSFSLNAAFDFTVDRSIAGVQRPELQPSRALELLCPFNPPPPSPDDLFPETCVSRRDIQARGFPYRDGKNATAIELPSAAVARDDPGRNDVAHFMQLVLNPSDYSLELGRNFSYIVAEKYQLNGRYRRAWWINPAYEWTPQQTGRQTIFTLSQHIVLFALISLDDSFTGSRRRMLLQSTSSTDNSGSGTSAQTVTFDTSPQSLLAGIFKIPEELVGAFSVQIHLSQQQACMDRGAQRRSILFTLDEYISATTTSHETVQISSILVDLADVQCGRRALDRRLLSFSAATATVQMMVVFSPSDYVAINLQAFANQPGILAVTPHSLSSMIQITANTPGLPPTYTPDLPPTQPDKPSDTPGTNSKLPLVSRTPSPTPTPGSDDSDSSSVIQITSTDTPVLPPTNTYTPDTPGTDGELPVVSPAPGATPTQESDDSASDNHLLVVVLGSSASVVVVMALYSVYRHFSLGQPKDVLVVDTLNVVDVRANLKSELVCPKSDPQAQV